MRTGKFIPVMLTPFLDNGTIDYPALAALTEYYIEKGALGLFANCQSSEMFLLTEQERLDITAYVVKIANGRVPVVSTGTFGGPIREQALFAQKIAATGVEAVIAITSLLAAKDEPDDLLENRMFELLSLTGDTVFGFYECPEPYKRILPADMLGRFAATGRVTYYKDTSLSENSIKGKLAATNPFRLHLYDAYMVNAVASLRAGCAGLSCIQGNYFPDLVVWLSNHFEDPNRQEDVDKVQQFFSANMNVMHNVYPITAKYILQKRGLPITLECRRDVGIFDTAIRQKMDVLWMDFEKLSDTIGLYK